jgi:hypothetical protein
VHNRLRRLSIDSFVIAALTAAYLLSFDATSAVNGPTEVFQQDTVYILQALNEQRPYPWNPQNHLLYHVLLETGYGVWQVAFANTPESVFRYVKIFTALTGLAFLMAMRLLFKELGLDAFRRATLLLLVGLSLAGWFTFAVAETHCLALPALAIYLVMLVRLARGTHPPRRDRLLFIASLVICVWTRTDLWWLVAVSIVLVVLPAFRQQWKTYLQDLATVTVVGAAGTVLLAWGYFGGSLPDAAAHAVQRRDRAELARGMMAWDNLRPKPLLSVARAVGVYSVVVPVGAPPQTTAKPGRPQTLTFGEPLRTFLAYPASAVTALALLSLLGWTGFLLVRNAVRGDAFAIALALQWMAAWLFYTWANPREPFLWTPYFLAFEGAAIAATTAKARLPFWIAVLVVAVLVTIHNFRFFYLPFSLAPG